MSEEKKLIAKKMEERVDTILGTVMGVVLEELAHQKVCEKHRNVEEIAECERVIVACCMCELRKEMDGGYVDSPQLRELISIFDSFILLRSTPRGEV